MRIGVLSDIHDNIWAVADLLPHLGDCDLLLFLGDWCAPFTLAALAEGFKGPIHAVWGNNDGDKLLLVRNADRAGNFSLHGDLAELHLAGRKVAMTHYPNIARALAQSGSYDLVCHGHDHTRAITRVGKTLLLNPGEVMGRFGVRSYAIYDPESRNVEITEF